MVREKMASLKKSYLLNQENQFNSGILIMNPKVLALNPEILPLNPRIFEPNPQETVIYPRVYNPRQNMRTSPISSVQKNPQTQKTPLSEENRVLTNVIEKLTF
jgi:hypothetical protein